MKIAHKLKPAVNEWTSKPQTRLDCIRWVIFSNLMLIALLAIHFRANLWRVNGYLLDLSRRTQVLMYLATKFYYRSDQDVDYSRLGHLINDAKFSLTRYQSACFWTVRFYTELIRYCILIPTIFISLYKVMHTSSGDDQATDSAVTTKLPSATPLLPSQENKQSTQIDAPNDDFVVVRGKQKSNSLLMSCVDKPTQATTANGFVIVDNPRKQHMTKSGTSKIRRRSRINPFRLVCALAIIVLLLLQIFPPYAECGHDVTLLIYLLLPAFLAAIWESLRRHINVKKGTKTKEEKSKTAFAVEFLHGIKKNLSCIQHLRPPAVGDKVYILVAAFCAILFFIDIKDSHCFDCELVPDLIALFPVHPFADKHKSKTALSDLVLSIAYPHIPGDTRDEKFSSIARAYEILTDPMPKKYPFEISMMLPAIADFDESNAGWRRRVLPALTLLLPIIVILWASALKKLFPFVRSIMYMIKEKSVSAKEALSQVHVLLALLVTVAFVFLIQYPKVDNNKDFDPYIILGIDMSVTDRKMIKKAYRNLALQFYRF